MAWMVVESVKLYPGNASFVAGAPMCGVRRVTVEEEVSECCEKWRSRTRLFSTQPFEFTYCPTCGRKL